MRLLTASHAQFRKVEAAQQVAGHAPSDRAPCRRRDDESGYGVAREDDVHKEAVYGARSDCPSVLISPDVPRPSGHCFLVNLSDIGSD